MTRFWTVYEKLNRENQKLFWNFVGGISHLPERAHRWPKKLTIRIDSSIPANGRPKSLPSLLELLLPESYDNEDKFKGALLEALVEGIGLEKDAI